MSLPFLQLAPSFPSYSLLLHLLHALYYCLGFLPSWSSHSPSHDLLCSFMIYRPTYINTQTYKYIPIYNLKCSIFERKHGSIVFTSGLFHLAVISRCTIFPENVTLSFFLWLHKIPLCVCTTFCLFFDRHLGGLHFLAIVTSTAINMGTQCVVCWF